MSKIATKSNKSVGNSFEREICDILGKNGFWAHNFAQNKDGQPADIIAIKNTDTFLIDCKECKGNRFELSRMEENQLSSMRKFIRCSARGLGFFCVRFGSGKIYMIPYYNVESMTSSSVTEEQLARLHYDTLDDFLRWR